MTSLRWPAVTLLLIAYACKTESSAPSHDSGGAGGMSNAAGKGSTAGKSGSGGSANAGAPDNAGSAGEGNVAGDSAGGEPNGAGGSGGTGHGGRSGTGGSGAGADAGDSGLMAGAAGEGESGAGSGTTELLADLPGPDDDSVTVLDSTYLRANQVFGVFADGDNALTIGGWTAENRQSRGVVSKLDDNLDPVWTTNAQYPNPNSLSGAYGWLAEQLAGNSTGVTFVGGVYHPAGSYPTLPDETTLGGEDAAIGAFDASGNLKWLHQVGSSGDERFGRVVAGADGSAYLFFAVGGQLPGKSSDLRNGPAVVKFDANGNQVYATQYKNYWGTSTVQVSDDDAIDMGVDAAGNVYATDGSGITKLDPSGTKVWYGTSPNDSPAPMAAYAIGVSPSGDGVFTFGEQLSLAADVKQLPLVRWDPKTGRPLWIRPAGTRQVTIDATEGVIWNGHFDASTGLLVTDDSVYLMGNYSNTYQNGSAARPAVTSAFVARYNFDGEQIWFKQFTVKLDSGATTGSNFLTVALAARPNGDIVLAGEKLLLELKASDGSVK